MKSQFFKTVLVSYIIFIFLSFSGGIYIKENSESGESLLPVWNEILHDEALSKKQQEILWNKAESIPNKAGDRTFVGVYTAVCGLLFAGMSYFFLYYYFNAIRPLSRMEVFAGEIARGNLDFPLEAERSKTFGVFTWAFDCMRTELKEARTKEETVREQNKTMIAGISHDIKTPISNIRNYCEGLSVMLDTSPEKRKKYLETIMRKCDEVSALTDDLFLHSLNDMDRLEVTFAPFDIRELYERDLFLLGEEGVYLFPCQVQGTVFADERRLTQVLDNILGNARKYAKGSSIEIQLAEQGDYIVIQIRDFGPGIPEEDFLYAKQKFYRGRNSLEQQGAGLGLYLSEVLMNQMQGRLELKNENGLVVSLFLKKQPESNSNYS